VRIKPILSNADQVHVLRTGKREGPGRRIPNPSIRRAGGPPQQETLMKNLILAAFATLSLGLGVANAQSLSHAAPAQTNTPAWSNFSGAMGGDGGGN
jgi:hypothetical protein